MSSVYDLTIAALGSTKNRSGTAYISSRVTVKVGIFVSYVTISLKHNLINMSILGSHLDLP